MRGTLIHAIASYRAELRGTSPILEREVTTADSAFVDRPNPDTCTLFLEAQRKYELHLTDYTQKRLLLQRQSIFGEGEKNVRAFLARTEMPPTVVANIQVANADLLSDPRDVCTRFREYYAELYRSKTDKSIGETSRFS